MSELYEQIEVEINPNKPVVSEVARIVALLTEQEMLRRLRLRKVILVLERPVGQAGLKSNERR